MAFTNNDLNMWSPISLYENTTHLTYFHLDHMGPWQSPSSLTSKTTAMGYTASTRWTAPTQQRKDPVHLTRPTHRPTPAVPHYTIATPPKQPASWLQRSWAWWISLLRFKRKHIHPMIKRHGKLK